MRIRFHSKLISAEINIISFAALRNNWTIAMRIHFDFQLESEEGEGTNTQITSS